MVVSVDFSPIVTDQEISLANGPLLMDWMPVHFPLQAAKFVVLFANFHFTAPLINKLLIELQ